MEKLLTEAQSIVEDEPGTTTWFALRFGHGEYGIFDAFPDDAGRGAHLDGRVVAALNEHSDLLDGEPEIERLDVLADKLTKEQVTKALLLRLPIKDSHADDAAAFLRDGASIVAEEPATVAWFAVRFADGAYGVFDVFPDTRARRAHLTGQIPRQLALHGLPWLGGLPNMSFADVLAQKL
ncbi:MAG: putative quinol monooxygenase [Acidimicrobiales bacterium]